MFWFHTALNYCSTTKQQTNTMFTDAGDRLWNPFSSQFPLWRSCSSDAAQFGETRDFGKAWTREELNWKVGQHPAWNPASPHHLLLLFTSLLPFPSPPSPLSPPCFILLPTLRSFSSSIFRSVKIPSLPPSIPQKSHAFIAAFTPECPSGAGSFTEL